MNLTQLVKDVQKAGRFKETKQARQAVNAVFMSLRQRNTEDNAGSVKTIFSAKLKKIIVRKDSARGVTNFLFEGGSHLNRINLANFQVRVQRAYEDVCDSEKVIMAVFGGLKKQISKEKAEELGERISDGDTEKLWENA